MKHISVSHDHMLDAKTARRSAAQIYGHIGETYGAMPFDKEAVWDASGDPKTTSTGIFAKEIDKISHELTQYNIYNYNYS